MHADLDGCLAAWHAACNTIVHSMLGSNRNSTMPIRHRHVPCMMLHDMIVDTSLASYSSNHSLATTGLADSTPT